MSDLSHRKSQKIIAVTDINGMPVKNTKLRFTQQSHEFLFGCGGFDTLAYISMKDEEPKMIPELGKTVQELMKDRTEKWLKLFNYATLPFYLGNFEPEEGKPNTEKLMNTALYLKERGVVLKGHPLVWHTVCADWLMKYDNKTILEKLLGRIDREVGGFKGIIDKWDVINEVVIMPVFDKYDNAVTRVCNEYGQVGLVKKVFDEAKKMNPGAELLLNDFNTTVKYEELIERCLDAGVPITTIGIQSHQHQGYWGKAKIEDVLGRFGRFGLPIHFTENTITSGDYLVPSDIEDLNDFKVTAEQWPSTPKGEERQCREIEEMYRTLFADPNVKGITTWDFADGAWLNAPCGFVRRDGSTKPSYDMLYDLIHKEWSTDTEVITDENGNAALEGFRGGYTLSPVDKDVKLSPSSACVTL